MNSNFLAVDSFDVSRETLEKLEAFTTLLKKWTKAINLIAPGTTLDLWERHIIDSAQILDFAPNGWDTWIDIGSGGGLPGVVVAILDPEERPVTLLESDARKCLFLKTVKRELSLNITVKNERIERTTVPPASVVSARALAPLGDLLEYAENLLDNGGAALFSKGENYAFEVQHAREHWDFEMNAHISRTNPDGRVLEISGIRRRER